MQNIKLKHIDLKNGYTQHKNLPERYRHGFGILTDLRVVNNLGFALEHNGLYICTIEWAKNQHSQILQ